MVNHAGSKSKKRASGYFSASIAKKSRAFVLRLPDFTIRDSVYWKLFAHFTPTRTIISPSSPRLNQDVCISTQQIRSLNPRQ